LRNINFKNANLINGKNLKEKSLKAKEENCGEEKNCLCDLNLTYEQEIYQDCACSHSE
jgi:hypothetical protein